MKQERLYKVAVLGSARVSEDSPAAVKVGQIGRAIAGRGGLLLTGGCPGLPHAAVLAARSAGGLTVGISPAMGRGEHESVFSYPLDSDVFIFTGMGAKGRNVVLVRSADACIFVGGGMGTLNEFTIAFDDLGPRAAIGVLAGSGGLSDEFPRLAYRVNGPGRALLLVESDPGLLVNRVFDHISASSND